jgi:putative DNA primase/helicase
MALCCLLAFWTGGDQTQMDQLFRQLGLLRKKWDEVHYADSSTYGEKTIERAIVNTSVFYDPDSGSESTANAVTPTPSNQAGAYDVSERK